MAYYGSVSILGKTTLYTSTEAYSTFTSNYTTEAFYPQTQPARLMPGETGTIMFTGSMSCGGNSNNNVFYAMITRYAFPSLVS